MKLDTYLRSLTLLVDGTLAKQSPFAPEELLLHLHDEASRWYLNSKLLAHQAGHMAPRTLARDTTLENAELFERYAEHCTAEIGRMLMLMPAKDRSEMVARMEKRLPPDVLPFVKDEV